MTAIQGKREIKGGGDVTSSGGGEEERGKEVTTEIFQQARRMTTGKDTDVAGGRGDKVVREEWGGVEKIGRGEESVRARCVCADR